MAETVASKGGAAMSDRVKAIVTEINGIWRKSISDVIALGDILIKAKVDIPHGAFTDMIDDGLPFGPRIAQMLMSVAKDKRITDMAKTERGAVLPTSYSTLYEMTKLSDTQLTEAVESKVINPSVERREITGLRAKAKRDAKRQPTSTNLVTGTADDLLVMAARGRRFGAIMADPPWRFESYSEKGEDRSAVQHYETQTINDIALMPVEGLAADDCVLFLWVLESMLQDGLNVMSAWGFTHKTTAFTWVKQNPSGDGFHMGLGYWTRGNAERCLLGTRGSPQRLDQSVRELIVSPLGPHSEKPKEVHDRIELLVDGPYLELYGRRQHPLWTVWGDEVGEAEQ